MSHGVPGIAHFVTDPYALGNDFSGASWDTWRLVLKGAFAEPLTDAERDRFKELAERDPPARRVRELWLAIGRRAGKDSVSSAIAAYMAVFGDFGRHLRRGERALVMCLACDRHQARIVFGYIRAYFESVPMLMPLARRIGDDIVELNNGVDIVVATNSYRAVRGRTVALCIFDEVAFWRDDGFANPDWETYRAVTPALSTLREAGAMLVGISTTYRRSGLLFDKWREHHGQDGDVLVIRQPSRVFNPLLDQAEIDADIARDPEKGAAEWLSEWRSDLSDFVDRAVVEALIEPGRFELPRATSVKHVAFCDPSGGSSDSMTLAIAHRLKEVAVLDCVREVRAPFSPENVVREFSATLKSYGLTEVTGDRYAGEWPREAFQRHQVRYRTSELSKNDIYIAGLPLLNAARVELLDVPRLTNQLCALERRTSRGGRDSIDHPSGAHDDVANAALGSLVLCSSVAQKVGVSAENLARAKLGPRHSFGAATAFVGSFRQ